MKKNLKLVLPNGNPDRAPTAWPTLDRLLPIGATPDAVQALFADEPDHAATLVPKDFERVEVSTTRLAALVAAARSAIDANEEPTAYLARIIAAAGMILENVARVQVMCEFVPVDAWTKPEPVASK